MPEIFFSQSMLYMDACVSCMYHMGNVGHWEQVLGNHCPRLLAVIVTMQGLNKQEPRSRLLTREYTARNSQAPKDEKETDLSSHRIPIQIQPQLIN